MTGGNKLLTPVNGRLMLVHVVSAALASRVDTVCVVTGHHRDAVEAALAGLPVRLAHNPDHASGLSSSLRLGLSAIPDDVEGAVVCLGDMPAVTAGHIDALIAAFAAEPGHDICVPVFAGRRGNPVLWGRDHFTRLASVTGDRGGRDLLRQYPVREVDVPDDGILRDIDDAETLARWTYFTGTIRCS